MKVAIMQPYFLPYIGYFQLMAAVDSFIVYDNIKYTKKGWINRNRILLNDQDCTFTLPLKKDSDFLDVCQRSISADFGRLSLLNKIKGAYQQAPYFKTVFPFIEDVINYPDNNLFNYIMNSLVRLKDYLGLRCQLHISSTIGIDHSLKSETKVIELCTAMRATAYINPPGGRELYTADTFSRKGIDLCFIQPKLIEYPQFGGEFVPWLSIIDLLMFNNVREIQRLITTGYELS